MCDLSLLSESRTFLGVIATLAALCVTLRNGNFMFDVLEDIKRSLAQKINTMLKESGSILVISTSTIVASVNELCSMAEPRRSSDDHDKIIKEGRVLLEDIGIAGGRILDELTALLPEDNIDYNAIGKTEEQVLAPLYTLFFCVFIFTCDEVIRFFPEINVFVLAIVLLFTTCSIIFWIDIWICFWRRTRKFQFERYKSASKQDGHANKHKKKSIISIAITLLRKTVISSFGKMMYVVLLALCLAILTHMVPFYQWICHGEWFSLACVIAVGLLMLYCSYIVLKDYSCSKLFILSIAGWIAFVSIIFLVILYYIAYSHEIILLKDVQARSPLALILAFAVLNGFVLPLLLPLMRYLNYEQYAKSKKRQAKKILRTFDGRCKSLYKSLDTANRRR
jgi:hypothetical protein